MEGKKRRRKNREKGGKTFSCLGGRKQKENFWGLNIVGIVWNDLNKGEF